MSRALRSQGWSSGTVLRLPTTSASGTGSAPSPRAATITPNTPSLISAAQAVPRRVASRRSAAEGVPPRCRWPRMVTRPSRPVSALQLLRQLQRAIAELRLDRGDGGLGLALAGRGALVFLRLALDLGENGLGLVQGLGLLLGHGAFGDRDDAEPAAARGCAGGSPRPPPRRRRESPGSGSRRRRRRSRRPAPASRRCGPSPRPR